MAGTLISGTLADTFGRKPTLWVNVVIILISWVVLYFSKSFILFMVSRVISGFAIGVVTTVGFMILSEIALVRNILEICHLINPSMLNSQSWGVSRYIVTTLQIFERKMYLISVSRYIFAHVSSIGIALHLGTCIEYRYCITFGKNSILYHISLNDTKAKFHI